MTISSDLGPFLQKLAQAWPEYPLSLDVPTWRERVERGAMPAPSAAMPGMQTWDEVITAEPRNVTVRVHRPEAAGALPVIVYMHGGGWVIGSHRSHDGITAMLAEKVPAVVVSVDYARAPEHRYPAAVEDSQLALEWVFENAARLGGNAAQVFVAGDSAGGNLATVLCLMNRDQHRERPIKGQLLIYPAVDTDFSRPSYLSEANAPFLKGAEMVWFWGQYCPDVERRREPYATPIHASSLAGLPPAYVAVAQHDPLHDEGVAYAQKLQSDGVAVRFSPGTGLIHGYLRATGISATALDEVERMCRWVAETARA